MSHPGVVEPKQWSREEYAAGYRARFAAIPNSEMAHPCWQYGWENADTEALETARHRMVFAEGGEDHFESTWGHLFYSGEEARVNGVLFDGERTEPWKIGWIAADIQLGIEAERE